MEYAYYHPSMNGIAFNRNAVEFSFNRDAEQGWGGGPTLPIGS